MQAILTSSAPVWQFALTTIIPLTVVGSAVAAGKTQSPKAINNKPPLKRSHGRDHRTENDFTYV